MAGGRTNKSRESVRLDPDKIVAAALAVADREGLSGTTLRKVGAELSVDPTAVYRHFASKDDLVAAMADRLFGGVIEMHLPHEWRTRLEVLLRAGRNVYRSHAAIVEVLAGYPEETPSLLQVNELILAALRDSGLDDEGIGLYHQVLVTLAIGEGIHEAGWGDPDQAGREAARRAYSALDPATHPNCAALAPHLFPPGDEVLDLMLGMALDAVEARAARNSTTTRTPTKDPRRTRG